MPINSYCKLFFLHRVTTCISYNCINTARLIRKKKVRKLKITQVVKVIVLVALSCKLYFRDSLRSGIYLVVGTIKLQGTNFELSLKLCILIFKMQN